MKRGWEGAVLKVLQGKDFRLTVLDSQRVGDRYQRVLVDGGGLLQRCETHPTMWIRLWFESDGRPHQRAYTVVDPDPATGRFSLEFALHDGCAARWALAARPGDTVEATVQGSRFRAPAPAPRHTWLIGDLASVPAVNSLLPELGPATVWLEYAEESERHVPVRAGADHSLTWVPRADGGRPLVDAVRTALPGPDDTAGQDWFWVACEAASTRAITRHLRREVGVDASRISAVAYWSAT